ncbi:MAG: DMT family transporter [Rhodospirillaceae bacterium]|nr:DMT family transporter [Rhodospirillaceae bacterium]MBT3627744.1 DMT family transporter [Rhodospirillaceae bacterium]MBT4426604.1 DMT family transporter [Rhodospirillaceae bacterium]MBT5038397.1 DMT family transporter [Rhodospirillaceae bacterium]MBT5676443.1 DMT family transporter [Rhodospirillaceae bacterium]
MATDSAERRQIPLRGILYMLATAVVVFPLLNASVKFLAADYSLVQIIWVRSIVHFLWMVMLFMPGMGWQLFRTQRLGLQLTRSALQLFALIAFVIGLVFLPMTTATSIYFTGPLMVVALAVPLLGERVGLRRWLAVLVGFLGALVIIRPGFEGMHWAALSLIASAFFYALYQILTRRAADHDDFRVSAVYTIVIALVISSIAVPFYWETPTGWLDWLVFSGLGIFGGLGHLFVIKAYEHAEASFIGPFDYGQLIGVTIIGYLVFAEFPDIWTWVGAAIIITSGIYVSRRERQIRPA